MQWNYNDIGMFNSWFTIANAVFIIFEHLRLKVNDLGGTIYNVSILIWNLYMFVLAIYLFLLQKILYNKKITLLIEEL